MSSFTSRTSIPEPQLQKWASVGSWGVDEAPSSSTSDGASISTRSSVCTSADSGNWRGRRACGDCFTQGSMQDWWKTEAPLNGLLQQEQKLQQQNFGFHDMQQQQHQAGHYGLPQQQQQIYQRPEQPLLSAQHLKGNEAAAKTMLQQPYMQQPFFQQQQQQEYGQLLQQQVSMQASPALLQQQVPMRANAAALHQPTLPPLLPQPIQQQPHMQYPYCQRQELPYFMHTQQHQQQQPSLQQHMFQEHMLLQQWCGWPIAKKQRPPGDPLVRLTVTVMKYRCRHTGLRKRRGHALENSTNVLPAGESTGDSAGGTVNGSDSSGSNGSSSSRSSTDRGSSGSTVGSGTGTGSSKSGSVSESVSSSSSMLFFGGKRSGDKTTNKKSEEAGSTALQAFTVTNSAAVPMSLLESLPLFGCVHNDFWGTPQRVVLLAFEQEDHVSADAIWSLLNFCCMSQTHAATAAAAAAALGAPESAAPAEDADDQDDVREETHSSTRATPIDVAAAAASFVARMSVEQLLLAYAGCLLLLNHLQGMQQQQSRKWKTFDAVEEQKQHPGIRLGPQLCSMPAQQQQLLHHPQQQQQPHHSQLQPQFYGFGASQHHFLHAQQQRDQQQQQHHFMIQAEQQQQQLNGTPQGHEGAVTAAAAATAAGEQQLAPAFILQHVRNAGAAKLERLLDEALLPVCCCIAYRYDDLRLLESCYWLLRHVLLEKGLPSEWKEQPQQYHQQVVVVGTTAAGGGTSSSSSSAAVVGQGGEEEKQDALSKQHQQHATTEVSREQQQHVYQQVPFQAQQEQLGLQQQQQQLGLQQHQLGLQQHQLGLQQHIYSPQLPHFQPQHMFTQPLPPSQQLETNRREVNQKQGVVDDSWMPPSLFAACTGRKACFSVHKATLKYLSHAVPLAAFWRVVDEEVRRKSAFLAEPRGYLHCEVRRVRTPSGNSFVYPHIYLLFADAACCRQLGLQQQLTQQQQQQQQLQTPQSQGQSGEERKKTTSISSQQQQQESRVMLLFGRRQSEYSTVEFFLPSGALLEAVSRCCFTSEPDEGVIENTAGAVQQLLAAAVAAEIHGKDYLGTLHAGFWGTRFSLRHWGMKQPCKLRGGENLPSPLAVASPADAAPFSAAVTAPTTANPTADYAGVSTSEAAAAAAATSSKKIIYTRVVKVYKTPDEEELTTMSRAAAVEEQLQQQYGQTQQQDYAFLQQQQHQEEYGWRQQQQAGDYVYRQQQPQHEPMQKGSAMKKQEQQQVGAEDRVTGRYEEVSTVSGAQQVSSSTGPCASEQHDKETSVNEEEGLRVKDGVPFFFSCSRSHDETLPAAGEVAEMCSATGVEEAGQLQASAGSSNDGSSSINENQEKQAEATGAAASEAAAPAVKSVASTQEELRPIHVVPHQQETELCTIEFETNLRGDMPRQMSVKLLRESGSYNLESVKPRWDESIRAYSLPFFGRAKVPSAKNVQLTPSRLESNSTRKRSSNSSKSWMLPYSSKRETSQGEPGAASMGTSAAASSFSGEDDEHEDEEANTSIYLMMGKLSKDVFALDFRAPVRIFEAFSIAAATLAKKRAVS